VLALLSAASWGTGDFFGGLATRRVHVLVALLATQLVGAALAITMVVVSGESAPQTSATLWAAAAGISGLIGLGALYLGLSRGTMGLVAPLSAVIAATVPAIVAMVSGEPVAGLVLVGMLFALAAVVAVAIPDRHAVPDAVRQSRGTRLGGWLLIVTAGFGFAGFFLGVDHAADLGGPVWWTLAAARSASTVLIVLILAGLIVGARAPNAQGARAVMASLAASAVGDTGGNLFFILSRAETTLAVSVVLSSLFPVSTVVLARVVLHERISRLALLGVVLAVFGVALIGVGSTAG